MTQSTTRLIQIAKGNDRAWPSSKSPASACSAIDPSIYSLAQEAIANGMKLTALVQQKLSNLVLDYDPIYAGQSDWRILPPIDHPQEPSRCLVSGTGLTHLGSARDRQDMHAIASEDLTDSMKMFRWGIAGGRPAAGEIGTPPEWFYKGTGTILRAHNEPLEIPPYAEDGGEEAEIAGIYIIAADGRPHRIGMACGNEFSDHVFEKKNYLNLAGSKLRTPALGPEIALDPSFDSVARRSNHRTRRQNALAQKNPHRRIRNVPQPAQHGAPPLQIRNASPPRRRPRPFLRRRLPQLRRRRPPRRRRYNASAIHRLRPRAAQSAASGRRQAAANRSNSTGVNQ